jgi:hypothetical protein
MSALTYHSIISRLGKEYGRNQWNLTVRKLIKSKMRLPDEFSTEVTLACI